MVAFIIAIAFTLGVSAVCSLLEAMILSTTTAEIEDLKRRSLWRGRMLEKFKLDMEETSSAILSLNTIANTLGSIQCGLIFGKLHAQGAFPAYFGGSQGSFYFSIAMTLGILVFSEIVPKNVGVLYRSNMQPYLVYVLLGVRMTMYPFSQVGKFIVRMLVGNKQVSDGGEEEIILLAEKNAKEGVLTTSESAMITNTLSLDDIFVRDIMTPRTVVTAYDKARTLKAIFDESQNIPFARIPVYEGEIDNIKGVVRRRDLLKALAEDKIQTRVEEYMQETVFIPENATATDALQTFLGTHQQLGVVVDEFGSVSGVVSMEDIVEHILGQEIYEKDDVAIDMRELARKKKLSQSSAAATYGEMRESA